MLQSRASSRNSSLTYRRDIDGLRALAIASVVLYHAVPQWLPGGFVGVDIFFVISGYLITGIVLKGQSEGTFSLSEFYSRRAKRIFPALIVVLVFCLVAGWLVLLPAEYQSLGKHVAAGAAYVSNHLSLAESGYFDVAAELKPLLHLWSLGIEEQFYLLWPLLLIVAYRFNLNPLTLVAVLFTVSFSLNVGNIDHRPVRVFYLAITRSWELLIGAMLAYANLFARNRFDALVKNILLRDPAQKPGDAVNWLAWTGLCLVMLAMFGLNQRMPFPGWWALFPTLGTACLIAAGEESSVNRRIFGSKLAVRIGLISYPLYLWHWPLLSLARIVEGRTPSLAIRVCAAGISVLLAWAT